MGRTGYTASMEMLNTDTFSAGKL